MSAMPPRTVLGEPLARRYDQVLAHEHLRIDIRCWLDRDHPLTERLRDVEVTTATAPEVQRNPFACLDNLVLDDEATVRAELEPLGRHGRTLIVEVTPSNVGRDLGALERLSSLDGVDVICGCGPYIAESRPGDEERRPEAYRDRILAEFAVGTHRPGVIGEIGTGDPIKPVERAALAGAAQAQAQLGVPLYVHLHPWARRGHEALDLVEAAGGDLRRTVLCHLDPQIPAGLEYHRDLLRRGCVIAFDIWGDDFDYGDVSMPTDRERIEATLRLVDDGFGDRLVHSQDVCTKTQLRRYGGAGYDHLPRVVAGQLAAAGLEPHDVWRQLAGNALDLFDQARRG